MKIFYIEKFKREYRKLPKDVQELAEKKERLFRKDPFGPQLKTHKLHGVLKGFWAFSINDRYRIIFDFEDKNIARFYSVGDHEIYE